MEKDELIIKIYETIGEIKEDVSYLKAKTDSIEVQTKKTNGRVNKLEDMTVPNLRTMINSKVSAETCVKHEKTLNEINNNTTFLQWFGKKPTRFAVLFFILVLLASWVQPDHILELFEKLIAFL